MTCCIIVCYRPDLGRLAELCSHVLGDGANVIVVDNTELPYLDRGNFPDGCSLITLGYNSGIAHAQNVGVAAALAAGATVLAFFDQDSKIAPGLLHHLVSVVAVGTPEIVAPLYVDEVTGIALPSVRLSWYGWPMRVHGAHSCSRYPVDIVISSGTVATRQVFDLAGTFDAGLFIDFVDTEWCLRCRGKQIPIHVVPTAVMRHSIGSRHFRAGPLTILVHSSTRCYYQIRNGFLLLRKRHVPLVFSLQQIASTLASRIILLFAAEDRRDYICAYLAAVRDGLKGISGARPD